MKKRFVFAAAALLLAATACSREETLPEAPEGYKILTIRASQEDTKTSYAGEKTFSWSAGDQISVLCNDGTNNFWQTFTATSAAATTDFTATVAANVQTGSTGGHRAALYPADSHHGTDFWSLSFYIPAERDFRAASGGHAETAIPMMAIGNTSEEYAFVNLTGAAKFSFSGISCKTVKFVFTVSGVKLNGSYGLFDYSETSAAGARWNPANAGNESEKTVTYYADVVDGKAAFYLPYATGGIWGYSSLLLSDAATGTTLYQNDQVGTINITQNQIVRLPVINVGSGGGSDPVSVKLSFTESDADIRNPERGFYDHCSFHYKDGKTPSSLGSTSSENSLVLALFYLEDFVTSDHISDTVVGKIKTVFSNIRTAGKKAVVRFAYTADDGIHPQEATPARILNHIADVTNALQENADVIYVVQAGWLGAWGEWYYVEDDFAFTKSGTKVTGYENRAAVLDALLAAVPENRQIELRTPFYKRYYLYPNSINTWDPVNAFDGTDANSRLGFHNDGFLGDASDIGTFKGQVDHDMWNQQSAYMVIGGETAYREVDETYAAIGPASQAMKTQHYSYLNSNPENQIMAYWIQQGVVSQVRKMLGYRLFLTAGNLSYTTLDAGAEMTVKLTLKNSGCASVIYPRPMKLVLLHGSAAPVVLAENLGEVRSVAPAGSQEFSATFTLPQAIVAGDRLALWLPDSDEKLQDKSAYAIRLANNETSWSSGYNVFYTF